MTSLPGMGHLDEPYRDMAGKSIGASVVPSRGAAASRGYKCRRTSHFWLSPQRGHQAGY